MEIESSCNENVSTSILEKQDKLLANKLEEVSHGKRIKNINVEADFPLHSFCNLSHYQSYEDVSHEICIRNPNI